MKDLYKFLPPSLVEYIENCNFLTDVTEIRLRKNSCVQFTVKGRIVHAESLNISQQQLEDILYFMCENSINAYEDEISNGFVTLKGGHRVGIGGEFYYNIKENKYLLKNIRSLNIRIAKSDTYFENQNTIYNSNPVSALIIGPPHSGKTSFIKNYADVLSKKYRVCLCDERYELCTDNIKCDVLQGIAKPTAIQMSTRTLNPQFIICDEIGTKEESENILSAINTGVDFICTAHGTSIAEVKKRPNIKILMDSGVFKKVIVLCRNKFSVKEVIDV
ncbi:MAG: hypothetical protein IJW74_01395 [Oscillospiraceae bacterium]|nr:hypothetical protein [Oscillospiraceae bacterium]